MGDYDRFHNLMQLLEYCSKVFILLFAMIVSKLPKAQSINSDSLLWHLPLSRHNIGLKITISFLLKTALYLIPPSPRQAIMFSGLLVIAR